MKRESKVTIITVVGLTILSIALWSYQTFVVPNQEADKYTEVYVAKEDIPTDSIINEDMLTTVKVNEDSIVPGAITELDSVVGKRAVAGVLEGELISETRLSEELTSEGELFVRVEPDFTVDIFDGDHVRVFVQDSNGNLNTLFDRKEVYSVQRVTNLLDAESIQGFYLLLEEQEVENYYKSKRNGLVILSRIRPEVTNGDIAKGTGAPISFDVDSGETENNEGNSVESNNRYTVHDGETFESIAIDLELSPEELSDLNGGITEVSAGDTIIVP